MAQITHALVPPCSTSEVSLLRGITEFYFTAKGVGRLRCADGEGEEEIELSPGTAVRCRPGSTSSTTTRARTRSRSCSPLSRCGRLSITCQGCWTTCGRSGFVRRHLPRRGIVERAGPSAVERWTVTRLPAEPDHSAPTVRRSGCLVGSLAGGYAHCQLPPATVTHTWAVLETHLSHRPPVLNRTILQQPSLPRHQGH
jgi:hypothetical protein